MIAILDFLVYVYIFTEPSWIHKFCLNNVVMHLKLMKYLDALPKNFYNQNITSKINNSPFPKR